MSKHYLSLLALATILCMMLFGASSCKKDDSNGGETPNPTEVDFFIDVDFLPKTETNGEVAPRMIVNFNDEMVMIEVRPSADTLLETMIFICPDNEAMMVCGNENLMICAAYDMETYTASDDVLLVTQMDDNTLLLTQCAMDWNTNTMTTGDMMVLPIDDDSKSYRNRSGSEDDWRIFFMNRFMKPLVKRIEKAESITGSIGLTPAEKVFTIFKYVLTTEMPIILFSDDPELIMDYMEYPFVTGTAQGAQQILLRFAPKEVGDMASCLVSALGLFTSDGYGNTNVSEPPMSAFFAPASKLTYAATQIGTQNPEFAVYLNVSNITENSVYLKGYINYGINHIMPVDMGYVYSINGGPENTVEDMNYQGKTLSGLHKATKYTVYAYARSLDKLVKSPAVTFWTLGFEAFPNSLTFPAEGDTKYVGLSYSHEDITNWDITSKPSWCTTTIDNLGLLAVTVGETTEMRSGIITITAHSNAFGNLTQDIAVTQLGTNSWDGTAWSFTGLLAGDNGGCIEGSVGFECTLMVNSVSDNDIVIVFPQHFSIIGNENCVIDGTGNLKYTSTVNLMDHENSPILTGDCEITFAQTSPITATASFNWYANVKLFCSLSGLLQGTLFNAKEIEDCETNSDFKEGFSRPFSISQ